MSSKLTIILILSIIGLLMCNMKKNEKFSYSGLIISNKEYDKLASIYLNKKEISDSKIISNTTGITDIKDTLKYKNGNFYTIAGTLI